MSSGHELSSHVVAAEGTGSGGHSAADAVPLPDLAVWGNLIIYVAAWALLMWPQHLPLGRPGIALVFAVLACGLRAACSAAWPSEHYPGMDAFGKVEVTPLALLFGLMLVNAYVKDTGLWGHVEVLLDSPSPRRMLAKICACAAMVSALLLNDTACFVLTPIVLSLCRRRRARSALPFLLALSTSANIGSSLTTIGNPQNALIAAICRSITFVGFARRMAGPVCAGLVLNTASLLVWYRKVLVFDTDEAEAAMSAIEAGGGGCGGADGSAAVPAALAAAAAATGRWSWRGYLAAIAAVVGAMLAGWIAGLATDDVALAAGAALMLLRASRRRCAGAHKSGGTETEFALGEVDYSLLVLFAGQFVLVGATVDTGLPQQALKGILGPCNGHLDASAACVFWFASVVLVLSNVISNVPVILMLQPLLAGQPAASAVQVWTTCAWVATVAGNLTMLGSAANLIVAQGAESRGEHGYTAASMARFSILPTLVVAAVGLLMMPPIAGVGVSEAVFAAITAVGAVGAVVSHLGSRRGRQAASSPGGCRSGDGGAGGAGVVSAKAAATGAGGAPAPAEAASDPEAAATTDERSTASSAEGAAATCSVAGSPTAREP